MQTRPPNFKASPQTKINSFNEKAGAESYIQIDPQGNVVFTDAWSHLLSSKISSPRLKSKSLQYDPKNPIGLVRHGILHGEEDLVCGTNGTGAIYVHGCQVKCNHCYQPEFFNKSANQYTSIHSLAQLMIEFEDSGVDSISIVIAHFSTHVLEAIKKAKQNGLTIPVVYNFSGMISVHHVHQLLEWIDLFVPDLKAVTKETSNFQGLPSQYVEQTLKTIEILNENHAKTLVRYLMIPSLNHMQELKEMVRRGVFVQPTTMISLLTHFQDPVTKKITTATNKEIKSCQDFLESHQIKTYIGTEVLT